MEKLSPESEVHLASQRRGTVQPGSPKELACLGEGLEKEVRVLVPQSALSTSLSGPFFLLPLPYPLSFPRRGWEGGASQAMGRMGASQASGRDGSAQ